MSHIQMIKWLTATLLFGTAVGSANGAIESTEEINHVLTDTTPIVMHLAMSQKLLSIVSRTLPNSERCAAREMVDASIGFREDVIHAQLIGKMIHDMQSVADQKVAKRYFSTAVYLAIGKSEADLAIVNDGFPLLRSKEAIEKAVTMRDTMIRLRDMLSPFAADRL